ncbi:MAG: glycosyltransferase family 61 protein [Chthoniobacterales bacterium]
MKRLWSTPLRIEPSTLAYAAAHPEVSVREIHAAESVVIPPAPFSFDAIAHEETSAPAFVFEIPNIDFWAHYGGAVVTSDNALLADLSPEVWGPNHHPIFSRWRLPPSQLLTGRIGIAVTPEATGNYYHWLLDALPRLLLLRNATGNFANYDALLLNGSRAPYETESLEALKIPREQIRFVDSSDRFHIASALFPSMDQTAKTIAPWKITALRQLVGNEPPPNDHRIYISRKRAPVRRIANEDEIAPLLRGSGFSIVQLEDKPWIEQACIFANAEIIITPHGAALANAVFCSAGAHICELSTRAGYRDWYLHLAAAAGLHYHCLEATPVTMSSSPHHAHENDDMTLSPESLQHFLSSL